jgi:DnaJ like chaperone protein
MILSWWGKLLGGTFGFMIAGPAGALLGTLFGHNFDKSVGRLWGFRSQADEAEGLQVAFFNTTFGVMGCLAKVDGRVSEREIAFAQAMMIHLNLTPEQKKTAMQLFREGKQPAFPLDQVLDEFRRLCRFHSNLVYQFVDIQLNMAYADGPPNASERNLLMHICDYLGFPHWQFETLEAVLRGRHSRQGYWQGGSRESGQERSSSKTMTVDEAYAILAVKREASDDEIKMAYRRLLNRYHPDKLAAKGLSTEAMERANEQTRQVKAAYDRLKQARGF